MRGAVMVAAAGLGVIAKFPSFEEERELALQWTGEAEGTLFMSRHNGGFRSTVLVLRSLARARDEHLCRQLLLFFLLSELTKRRVL